MVQYYLKQPFKIKQFVFRNKNIYENQKKLLTSFLKVLKKTKPNAIVFDAYYNPKGRPAEDAIKKLLHREKRMGRNNQKKACLFRLKKTLFYKNKPVAWVLKPCYDNF